MDSARQTQIVCPRVIADRFVDLSRHVHDVTLCFEGTRIHYPVSVVAVDRAVGRCLIDITALGDLDSARVEESAFTLYVRQSSVALHTSVMRSTAVLSRADRLGLRCPLPARVTQVRHRSDFRAALTDAMTVSVELVARDGTLWHTTLCNLSVGGCMLALPLEQARGLEAGPALYRLRACFPNGESFQASSHIRHRHRDAADGLIHLGIVFDIGLYEDARHVWFYVREIEREVVRQTQTRSELRPLAPSQLFASTHDRIPDDSRGAARSARAAAPVMKRKR